MGRPLVADTMEPQPLVDMLGWDVPVWVSPEEVEGLLYLFSDGVQLTWKLSPSNSS